MGGRGSSCINRASGFGICARSSCLRAILPSSQCWFIVLGEYLSIRQNKIWWLDLQDMKVIQYSVLIGFFKGHIRCQITKTEKTWVQIMVSPSPGSLRISFLFYPVNIRSPIRCRLKTRIPCRWSVRMFTSTSRAFNPTSLEVCQSCRWDLNLCPRDECWQWWWFWWCWWWWWPEPCAKMEMKRLVVR